MNIKIDGLNIISEDSKIIIKNIDKYDIELDSSTNQLILIKKKEQIYKNIEFSYKQKDILPAQNNSDKTNIEEYDYDSDSDITNDNDDDLENDIDNDNSKSINFLFNNVEKDLIKDVKYCKLEDAYVDNFRVTTVIWKSLLLYLYSLLGDEELFTRRFVSIFPGKPSDEQKNRQKYYYCVRLNISVKSSSTETLMKKILYIVRKKGLKIRLIYKKKDGEIKEFMNY